MRIVDDKVVKYDITPAAEPLLVDFLGSATMMFRKEILEKCSIDTTYFVGLWDYDLSMQMRKAGWKLSTIALDAFRAQNNGGGPPEYKAVRYNQAEVSKSCVHFEKKWGLSVR
jgi:GT2 family glycosyltransferase